MTRRRLLLTLAIALVGLQAGAAPRAKAPKNVILLIGDGMGFAQTTLGRIALGTNDASLRLDSMSHGGMAKTYPLDTPEARVVITDSAAAATALATGHKTKNGMIAMLPDGAKLKTVLEAAQDKGKRVGLVTTVTISHATPAGFGAHVPSRGQETDIAPQYLDRQIDVLLGGGEAMFVPQSVAGSKRKDDRDLLAEARRLGYTVARTKDEMDRVHSGKLLGLFAMEALKTEPPEPSLAEMTAKALDLLGTSKNGFFLMSEGGQIDWGSHANNGPMTVKQMLDFDAAIGVALDFARKRGDTLVVVTADHETGGLALVGATAGTTAPYSMAWGSKGHSATVVPLLADGPGAELFSGVLNNTEIPKRIAKLMGLNLN